MALRTLRAGLTGEDVKRWQAFLQTAGHYQGALDGVFGARTDAATKSFQAAVGLAPDGVAGDLTLAKALESGFALTIDDPTLGGATMPLNNVWPPPAPPDGVDLFVAPDPRVNTQHRVGALPCPPNPPPPLGWAYWTAPVSPVLAAFALLVENDDAKYPMGSFVQTVRDHQRVAARVEWHTYQGRTGAHGCFRGTSLFRTLAPSMTLSAAGIATA